MEPGHHYQPLPRHTESPAFRLLSLEPGRPCDPIVCQLHTASIPGSLSAEAHIGYDALSYTWGEELPAREIILGAWPMLIRENLWYFLRERRHHAESITLWVDALCIDQSNLNERASQVHLMDQIFQGAQRVLVWLGTADAHSDAAIGMVKDISTTDPGTMRRSQAEYHNLIAWWTRPYWTRTWIVQEFLLARDVVFVCGSNELDWQTTKRFLNHIRESINVADDKVNYWHDFTRSPAYLLMKQKDSDERPESSLLTLLIRNQYTECHDPRDKVYAMLGLATETEAGKKIQVSYTKDRRRLLVEVIDQCNVPSKDVLRLVQFLSHLLMIEPASGAQINKVGDLRGGFFTIRGFTVGNIMHCESLKALPDLMLPQHSKEARNFPLSEALVDIGQEKLSSMLHELNKVNMETLQFSQPLFDAISQRTWPGVSAINTRTPEQARPGASLVVIATLGCVEAEVLVGVGFGNLSRGDTVVQFLGHEIAIAIDGPFTNAHRPKITGRLLCVKRNFNTQTHDSLTQQVAKYFTIQNEADCRRATGRTDFNVNVMEALALGQ